MEIVIDMMEKYRRGLDNSRWQEIDGQGNIEEPDRMPVEGMVLALEAYWLFVSAIPKQSSQDSFCPPEGYRCQPVRQHGEQRRLL